MIELSGLNFRLRLRRWAKLIFGVSRGFAAGAKLIFEFTRLAAGAK